MRVYKTYQKILICILPPLTAVALFFAAKFATQSFTATPDWVAPCILYEFTGISCASCGATRSVIALANGDVLLSLRQNLLILPCIIYVLLAYIEFVLRAFGVKLKRIFTNYWCLAIIGIITIIYTIVRNIFPILAPIPI